MSNLGRNGLLLPSGGHFAIGHFAIGRYPCPVVLKKRLEIEQVRPLFAVDVCSQESVGSPDGHNKPFRPRLDIKLCRI